MLPLDQEWTALAECAQVDPDLWHPDKGQGGGNHSFAKKVCDRCPVKRECLDYALAYEAGEMGTATSYRTGIYGGLSAQERRPLVKARRDLAATGTEVTAPAPAPVVVEEKPAPRQYGLPYVGGANGGGHYPLPSPDRFVKIEGRGNAKPSIDWGQPATPDAVASKLRCRWCRQVTAGEDLVDDVCKPCRDDAEQKFTVPAPVPADVDLDLDPDDVDGLTDDPDHNPELPTEGKQGKPTTGSSAPGANQASSTTGRAPVAGPSTHREKDPEPVQETRPATGSGPLDVVDYCHQLLRDTTHDPRPLVQVLRANALAALAALDLVANPETPVAVPAHTDAPETPVQGHPDTATGTTGFQTFQKPRRRRSGSGPKGDEPDIVRLYTEDQMSSGEIALQLHTTAKRVRAVLDRAGIERRDDRTTRSGGKLKDYPAEFVTDVRRLYLEQQLSQAEVAEQLDTTVKVVQNVMARHDIPARPSASASSKAGVGHPIKLDDTKVDQLVERYVAGESANALAKAFGVSVPSVLNRLRQRGVQIRGRGGNHRQAS